MEAFKIGRMIRGINTNVRTYINEALKVHDLSEGHFEYFSVIYANQGINQKTLGDIMKTSKAGVTKAVKRLLDQGLIYRQVDEKDQRNYGLYVTEKGQDYIKIFHDISDHIQSKVLGNFKPDEKAQLFNLLDKLHENTKKL